MIINCINYFITQITLLIQLVGLWLIMGGVGFGLFRLALWIAEMD